MEGGDAARCGRIARLSGLKLKEPIAVDVLLRHRGAAGLLPLQRELGVPVHHACGCFAEV